MLASGFLRCLFFAAAMAGLPLFSLQAAEEKTVGDAGPKTVDGIVQPQKPVGRMLRDAMQLLQRTDNGYVPGKLGEKLPPYVQYATFKPDGSPRMHCSFPAFHHSLYILAFLRYYAFTGETEWLWRARDLADWNIANSTAAGGTYSDLPFSVFEGGKPRGSADGRSIETDKPALMGSAYLAVYDATGEQKYLEAAKKIADTLAKNQRADGSWPFRVIPEEGTVYDDYGCGAVFAVEFFENLLARERSPKYSEAHDKALQWMLENPVKHGWWAGFHEDVGSKGKTGNVVFMPMAFTCGYLLRKRSDSPQYLSWAEDIHAAIRKHFVHLEDHALAPAPGVAEQLACNVIMPVHTACYCSLLCTVYEVKASEDLRKMVVSGINSCTWAQIRNGAIMTWLHLPQRDPKSQKFDFTKWLDALGKQDDTWYSIHIGTLLYVFDAMAAFPEIAPEGEDHVLGFETPPRNVRYEKGKVSFSASRPSCTTLKLSFEPASVKLAGKDLPRREMLSADAAGWTFDKSGALLKIRHEAGGVVVSK